MSVRTNDASNAVRSSRARPTSLLSTRSTKGPTTARTAPAIAVSSSGPHGQLMLTEHESLEVSDGRRLLQRGVVERAHGCPPIVSAASAPTRRLSAMLPSLTAPAPLVETSASARNSGEATTFAAVGFVRIFAMTHH